ncbi:LysR family transcriptional regulator [Desertibaculum subflavum]|uniref:LysR family transcriptional regulator n=1 Tax=Desertibaculum subflavum TaxID=2268458 RepID=UPI000E662FAD
MDASDLRLFEAVARTGGIGRAAAALNTVQSNVTQRLRELEAELGQTLFHRHSRGVTLTPAGQRLLPYARRVQELIDEAMRAARDDGMPAGPLAIGSLETTAALRLPPVLVAYAGAHPAVDLALRTGTTAELIAQVLDRRLEAAFVCGPVRHPELIERLAFREELVLAAPAALATLDGLAALGERRLLVLRAGCSYRQRLEDILARRGIVGTKLLEFGTVDAILGCVAAGIGLTLLPRGIVEPARRRGGIALHALPPGEAMVETVFIRRSDGFVSSALAAFQDGLPVADLAAAAD